MRKNTFSSKHKVIITVFSPYIPWAYTSVDFYMCTLHSFSFSCISLILAIFVTFSSGRRQWDYMPTTEHSDGHVLCLKTLALVAFHVKCFYVHVAVSVLLQKLICCIL